MQSGCAIPPHDRGPVYYRHWACPQPRAAVIFLHGFGEHTGLYHRYGFALNDAGIDVWGSTSSATACHRENGVSWGRSPSVLRSRIR